MAYNKLTVNKISSHLLDQALGFSEKFHLSWNLDVCRQVCKPWTKMRFNFEEVNEDRTGNHPRVFIHSDHNGERCAVLIHVAVRGVVANTVLLGIENHDLSPVGMMDAGCKFTWWVSIVVRWAVTARSYLKEVPKKYKRTHQKILSGLCS